MINLILNPGQIFPIFILFSILDLLFSQKSRSPSQFEKAPQFDSKYYENAVKNLEKRHKEYVAQAFKKPHRDYTYQYRIMDNIMKRSKAYQQSFIQIKKSNILSKLTALVQLNRAPPLPKENMDNFFPDKNYTKDITKFPLVGEGKMDPWSNTYWPIRNGILAVRYMMNKYNNIGMIDSSTKDYKSYYTYTESIARYCQPCDHNRYYGTPQFQRLVNEAYSPSEKYDLFVGDYEYTLTNYLKTRGKDYVFPNGDVAGWMGICHGWSPAAYYFKRPNHTVTVTAYDGKTKINFYPDDIKGLASLFLANAKYYTLWVGSVCRIYDNTTISRDPDTGLYLEPICASANPGGFITIMANFMGIKGHNFILDPFPDPEIWNQPVKNYTIRYFNLVTGRFFETYLEARANIETIKYYGTKKNDKFLKFAARQAANGTYWMVGAYINTTYTVETNPIHSDDQLHNYYKDEGFLASIEVDQSNNVLGGEWKENVHPNFAWSYDFGHDVKSNYDEFLPHFDGSRENREILKRWVVPSSNLGQVFKAVVNYLIDASQGPKPVTV